MRVIQVEQRGGPEVLTVAEQPAPQPGPGQIVAEIAAAGVNYMDIYQREGVAGYRPPLPFVTGGEGAGTIVAVGADVTDLAVGEQVATTIPPRSLIIWVSSSPTPPAAACTTVTSPGRTGYVPVTK
jgi:NADPH2:quinone reductase